MMSSQEPPTTFLTRARHERGWTKQEAASALGISQRYLAKFESGERSISKKLLPKFSELYGASVVGSWRRDRFDDRESFLDSQFLDSLISNVDAATIKDGQSAVKRRCGNYLKVERLKRSWTADIAAKKHGVPPATWNDWESGKTVPNAIGMLKLIEGPFRLHRIYAAWWHWPLMQGSRELPGEISFAFAADQWGSGFLSAIATRHSSRTNREMRLGKYNRDGIKAALRYLLMFHQYGAPQYLADLAAFILDHREKHPDVVLSTIESDNAYRLFGGLSIDTISRDLAILNRYTSNEHDVIIGACSDANDSLEQLMESIRQMQKMMRGRCQPKCPRAGLRSTSREGKYKPIGPPPFRRKISPYLLTILNP